MDIRIYVNFASFLPLGKLIPAASSFVKYPAIFGIVLGTLFKSTFFAAVFVLLQPLRTLIAVLHPHTMYQPLRLRLRHTKAHALR